MLLAEPVDGLLQIPSTAASTMINNLSAAAAASSVRVHICARRVNLLSWELLATAVRADDWQRRPLLSRLPRLLCVCLAGWLPIIQSSDSSLSLYPQTRTEEANGSRSRQLGDAKVSADYQRTQTNCSDFFLEREFVNFVRSRI